MRYLVIENTAVLASREHETVGELEVAVSVAGVPDGASLYIQHETAGHSYGIVSEATVIPAEHLNETGVYSVAVRWTETDPETGDTMEHEAIGNSFSIISNETGRFIIPAQKTTAYEIEQMWRGIVCTLEVILPLIDSLKNGNDVI